MWTCTDAGRECSYVAGAIISVEAGNNEAGEPEPILDDGWRTNTVDVPTYPVSRLTVAKFDH
jgi:hypothetical protein